MSGADRGLKAHVWSGKVCTRCSMRSHWEGARHGCTGVMSPEEHRVRNRRHASQKKARKQAGGVQ